MTSVFRFTRGEFEVGMEGINDRSDSCFIVVRLILLFDGFVGELVVFDQGFSVDIKILEHFFIQFVE